MRDIRELERYFLRGNSGVLTVGDQWAAYDDPTYIVTIRSITWNPETDVYMVHYDAYGDTFSSLPLLFIKGYPLKVEEEKPSAKFYVKLDDLYVLHVPYGFVLRRSPHEFRGVFSSIDKAGELIDSLPKSVRDNCYIVERKPVENVVSTRQNADVDKEFKAGDIWYKADAPTRLVTITGTFYDEPICRGVFYKDQFGQSGRASPGEFKELYRFLLRPKK